MTPLARNKM